MAVLVGLAVGIRVALALTWPFYFEGDSGDYDHLARAILAGEPYQVYSQKEGIWCIASRMPGYPVLIAGVYAMMGPSVRAALILQALMGGFVTLLTYLLARRMGQIAGLMAAALVAVDVLSVGFSAALLSEAPFTLVLVLAIWQGVRMTEESDNKGPVVWVQWAVLGLLWAVGCYLRASALWCIVPLGLWIAWCTRRGGILKAVGGALLAVVIVFLALSPWLIRNYRHFHSGPLRLTTLEGLSLYEAVYPQANGGPRQDAIALPPEMRLMNEAQRNDEWARRAWIHVRDDPMRIARLAMVKALRTWSPTFNAAEFRGGPIQWLMAMWYLPLLALAALGLAGGVTPRPAVVLVAIPIVYWTLLHSLFLGSVRYRVPLMPLVCFLAAAGVVRLVKLRRRGKPSPAAAV